MALTSEVIDSVVVARFLNSFLDATNVGRLRPKLLESIRDQPHVVLDVGNLHYVDCIGFELLLDCVRNSSAAVRFGGVRPELLELFAICQLQRSFQLFSTLEEAMAAPESSAQPSAAS